MHYPQTSTRREGSMKGNKYIRVLLVVIAIYILFRYFNPL